MEKCVVASAAKNGAIYIKRKTGTGNIDLTLDGGATWTTKAVTGTWTRFDITQTLADEDFGIRIVTSGDAIWVWQADVTTNSFATSAIPTTSAAATRNADVLSYPTAGNVLSTAGSAYAECTFAARVVADPNPYVIADTTSNRPLLYIEEGAVLGVNRVDIYDGVNNVTDSGTTCAPNTLAKGMTRWGPDLKAALNGSVGAAAAFDGSMNLGAAIGIGHGGVTNGPQNGIVRNVKIWTSAANDAAMMRATR